MATLTQAEARAFRLGMEAKIYGWDATQTLAQITDEIGIDNLESFATGYKKQIQLQTDALQEATA